MKLVITLDGELQQILDILGMLLTEGYQGVIHEFRTIEDVVEGETAK